MSGATEIYICRPGQSLKEGEVQYGAIESRGEAEADASRRLQSDPSIAKIAYYAVSESGDFRCIYTKNNPNAAAPSPKRTMSGAARPRARRRSSKPKKPSLIRRLRALLEED